MKPLLPHAHEPIPFRDYLQWTWKQTVWAYRWIENHAPTLFRFGFGAMSLGLVMMLAMLIYAASGVRLLQDDFGFFASSRTQTIEEIVGVGYAEWTGRYSWLVLVNGCMKATGGNLSWVLPLFLAAWVAVWTWCLGRSGAWGPVVLIVAAIAVSCVLLTPTLSAFFWFAAFTNILPALIFLPVLLVISRVRKLWAVPAGALAAFVLVGFNEQSALIVVFGCLVLVVKNLVKKEGRFAVYALFAGAVLGLGVSSQAPGNAIRAETVSGDMPRERSIELGFDAAQGIMQSILPDFPLDFPSWLDVPELVLNWPGVTLFWVVIAAMVWGQKFKPSQNVQFRSVALTAVAGWALCTLITIVTALAIKQVFVSYERVFFIPYFVAALTMMGIGYSLRAWATRRPPRWSLPCWCRFPLERNRCLRCGAFPAK